MKIAKNLNQLPLTKSKPSTLESLFGTTDIEPMWVADMDFEVAEPIQASLIQRIADAGFGYEYKPDTFFEAQKNWYRAQYGIDLNPSQVLYSPSITTTMAVLIEEYTSEGAGIIIQPPVFMEFREVARKTKRRIDKNPLKLVNQSYQIDFEDLESKAKLESNKILIICNPHNPVGRVWTPEELQHIVRICKDHNLLLISDEIHKDIVLFENRFTSALHFIEEYEKIVVCTSESKTFNLCGISDSMAIIPDAEIRNVVSTVFIKYNLGRTNALTRVALEAAYKHGQAWLSEVLKTIEQNVETIEQAAANTPIDLIKPEGTYQVWLSFARVYKNTKEMFRHLTEASGIGLNAGHWFGREGALFVRMNIATSNQKVQKAIEKIKAAVAEQ